MPAATGRVGGPEAKTYVFGMDGHISVLPAELRGKVSGRDIVVFDGDCVLCSWFFRFVLWQDKSQRFSFVTAQSPLGQALYTALDLSTRDFETNLVIVGDQIFARLDAFAAVMHAVGQPWRLLSVCRFLPTGLKTVLYERIARNRYAIFGRNETCLMPTHDERARFVAEGY